ncbi:hypothetical protein FACS189465_0130 [Clostridia bacterium]|nr:hypothetical protein FACS189465_0130 [Clostridia bacterium]
MSNSNKFMATGLALLSTVATLSPSSLAIKDSNCTPTSSNEIFIDEKAPIQEKNDLKSFKNASKIKDIKKLKVKSIKICLNSILNKLKQHWALLGLTTLVFGSALLFWLGSSKEDKKENDNKNNTNDKGVTEEIPRKIVRILEPQKSAVPGLEPFEIQNGIIDMNRDIILKLLDQLKHKKDGDALTRAVIGMCHEHYMWKKHNQFKRNRYRYKDELIMGIWKAHNDMFLAWRDADNSDKQYWSICTLEETVNKKKRKWGKSFNDIYETVRNVARETVTEWQEADDYYKNFDPYDYVGDSIIFVGKWTETSFQAPNNDKIGGEDGYIKIGEDVTRLKKDQNNIGYKELSSWSIEELKAYINEAEEVIQKFSAIKKNNN